MSDLPPEDFHYDLIGVGSVGGQQVGPRLYDMKITHTPTGAVVIVPASSSRSQHKQRQLGLEALEWMLANV
mgnify:FL=1